MSAIVFAIPGDIALPTGGYGYDRRLLREWREAGVDARHLALPGGFPDPDAAEIAETRRLLRAQPADAVLLVDGLAHGAFPADLAAEFGKRIVALVHHPLAHETGIAPARAAELRASETTALRHARAILVTSETTRRLLAAEYGVPADKVTVAEPGVDAAERATGSAQGEPTRLLAVGSIVPRKGYDVLVEALASLRDGRWSLTVIGAPDRAPATTDALRTQIREAGLADRITLAGAVDDAALARAYDGADLFVLPSLFEGYGMVLTEALARGLPIVCTTGGAAAETAPDDAALKVPPGDAAPLAKALARMIDDRATHRAMADAAWAAAHDLPRWPRTAGIVSELCRKVG